ncbi:MAG: sugar phosphate isomerase/epimerase family protein, partial [Chloroflexia bacterium]
PLDPAKISEAGRLAQACDVEITALAYYAMSFKPASARALAEAYDRVFDAAETLGVGVVASMSGFDADKDWDGNVQLFAERFGPIAESAERRGLRIAIENWMGYGGRLPFRPVNMGGSPDTWDAWFDAVPNKALGIEFDPSHLYWQGIDHIRALREYSDRVYHVHAKDTQMLPERRYRGGVNGDYYRFRIPGYGEINWTEFITTVQEVGYDGGVAIEHEDPVYSGQRFDEGLVRGWQVLHPLIAPAS